VLACIGTWVHFKEMNIRDDTAVAPVKPFFLDLLSEAHSPAPFHCTTGKDRTGWAAATLLTLLGVPDEKVMREFLLNLA